MSPTKAKALQTGKNWRHLVVIMLVLPIGGCFQPLYGEAAHPGLLADLQGIAVEPVKGSSDDLARINHYLENDLIANLNGTGTHPEPKYRLTVITSMSTSTPTVTSQIGLASSSTMTVNASYVLTPTDGAAATIKGAASNAAVYDITVDRFSNLRAKRDDEIRLSKALADEIELRLAAALGDRK